MPTKQKKKITKPAENQKRDRMLKFILITLFAVFLALFTTSKLTNEDDYFWHFATGRYIVENNQIPSADVFSFPTIGQQWIVTEWLWDVLNYLIIKYTGYAGVSIFTSILFFIMFFVYFRILRKFHVSYSIIFLFLILLLFGIFERLTPRPHIISYLFLVLLLAALINCKYFNRYKKTYLYLIPLMFMVWANMHMGCIIGIFIFGLFCATEVIIYFKPGKFSIKEIHPFSKSELIRLGIIFFLSILAMFVNPHGVMTFVYAATSQMNMKMLHEAVREWISPFDPSAVGLFQTVIYIIFLISGVGILYFSYKKKDLFSALLFIIFSINSIRAIRFTVDYLVITSIYIIVSLNFIFHNAKSIKIKSFIDNAPSLKIIVSAILVLLIITIPNDKLYLSYLKYARFFGFGIDKAYYPEAMFRFIKEKKIDELTERPFNTFECGGYYVWNFPGKLNFFDSRDLNDYIMNEYQVMYSKIPGYEKKIRDYNFDIAICVVPDILSEPQLMKKNVMSYFCTQTNEWKQVFWNDRSLLFVRNIPKFAEIISKYEYKYVTPYNFFFQRNIIDKGLTDNKNIVLQEINRKRNEDPESMFLNAMLRTYANKLNN